MRSLWLLAALALSGVLVSAEVVSAACDSSKQFTCANDQCIDLNQVCDFTADCQAANDETNCGPCDFDGKATCGWSNPTLSYNESIEWRLTQNVIVDHSKNSLDGGCMMLREIDTQSVITGLLGIYTVSPESGPFLPSCAISFWYYASIESSNNTLKLIFGTIDTDYEWALPRPLWSKVLNSSAEWTYVVVPVGFRLRNSRLVFQANLDPTEFASLPLIAIDEVTARGCDKNAKPAESFDCDFESACNWYADTDTEISWVLASGHTPSEGTGPTFDHTFENETGHYVYLPTASASRNNVARISSQLMSASFGVSCLSFWYHMFGTDVEKLNVYLRFMPQNDASEATSVLLWTRARSAGNEWKQAEVPVTSEIDYMIVFEGLVGKTYLSEIALDDIKLLDGPCMPSDKFECDFETSTCDFESQWYSILQSPNDTDVPQWLRKPVSELKNYYDVIPSKDHTTDTPDGFVMFASLEQGLLGENTLVLQSANISGISGPACVTFYYRVEQSAELRVNAETETGQAVWSSIESLADDNVNWHLGQLEISVSGFLRVDFIARCKDKFCSQVPVVAIDDIYIDKNACKRLGDCDFERDTCAYSGLPNEMTWLRNAGRTTTEGTGPIVDATYGTDKGFYAYVPAHTALGVYEKAFLVSQLFPATNARTCYRFSYHMFGRDVGQLSVSLQSNELKEWVMNEDRGDVWHQDELDLGYLNDTWQIVIQATVHGAQGDVAVDDLIVYNSSCADLPCLKGSFECAVGKCITGNKVCDFVKDCDDGKDEQDCGQCSFDDGAQCGWRPVINADWPSLTWHATSGKFPDNTQKSTSGWYLTAGEVAEARDEKGRADVQEAAVRVETPIQGPIQAACAISFAYYMDRGNADAQVKPVLSFITVNSTGQEERVLWSADGWTGRLWKTVVVPIGYRLRNSKFQLEARFRSLSSLSSFPLPDVAVDDVRFVDCDPGIQPNLTVSCDFESSCGWFSDTDLDLEWVSATGHRPADGTGPTFDHTTGKENGHYVYLPTANASQGAVARLASVTIYPLRFPRCLSFWYHMYGMDVERLNVLQRFMPGEEVTEAPSQLVWSRSRSNGNRWSFAQAPLFGEAPFSIVFEGYVGKTFLSEIAIDDIVLSMTESCHQTSTVECDFEYGECGFRSSWTSPLRNDSAPPETELSWSWRTASSLSEYEQVLSAIDHTSELPDGYVMFTSLESALTRDDTVRLDSIVLNVTSPVSCVTFYYQIGHAVELSVQIERDNDSASTASVWSSSEKQFGGAWSAPSWHFGQFEIADGGIYQISFVAKCDSSSCVGNKLSVFALDDLFLNNSACPALGSCNFERDLCAYTNVVKNDTGAGAGVGVALRWLRNAGATLTEGSGPSKDVTTGSDAGFYAYVPAHQGFEGAVATMRSEAFGPLKQPGCLRFWYHMYGDSVGSLSIRHLADNVTEWQNFENQGDRWIEAELDLASGAQPWRIEVAAQISGPSGDIAVDELRVMDRSCSRLACLDGLFECTRGECIEQYKVCDFKQDCGNSYDELDCGACDFENGLVCGWASESGSSSDIFWRSMTGVIPDASGWSMMLRETEEAIPSKGPIRVAIQSPVLGPMAPQCSVSFSYYMDASIANNTASVELQLRLATNDSARTVWRIDSKDSESGWRRATVPLGYRLRNSALQFSALVTNYEGNDTTLPLVAFDEVSYDNCSWVEQPASSLQCDFESPCAWYDDTDSDVTWQLHSGHTTSAGTGPNFDHTWQNQTGHYIYLPTVSSAQGNSSRVSSALIDGHLTRYCLSFWYHMFGMDVERLDVYQRYKPNPEATSSSVRKLWSRSKSSGNEWRYAQVTLLSDRSYSLVFEGFVGRSYLSEIALDDIFVNTTGPCLPQSSQDCDFEFNDCNFRSRWVTPQPQPQPQPDGLEWRRVKLAEVAQYRPAVSDTDHSTGEGDGHAMFTTLYGGVTASDEVHLESEVFPMTGSICVSFYYEVASGALLEAEIQTNGNSSEALWNSQLLSHKGGEWHFAQFNAAVTQPFQVVLVAKCLANENCVGSESSLATIDDFYITDKGCPKVGTFPGSCDFERDMCAYSNVVDDPLFAEANWLRNAGATVTDGTGPSYDVTTGTDAGFYLFIPARSTIDYENAVLLSEVLPPPHSPVCVRFWYHLYSDDLSLLYARIVKSGDDVSISIDGYDKSEWRQGQLEAPRLDSGWRIKFDAYARGKTGDVAIDDISTYGTRCSNLPCIAGTFQCSIGSCLQPYQVCDFSSNCENGLDERDCGACTFDDSATECGWTSLEQSDSLLWERSSKVAHLNRGLSLMVVRIDRRQLSGDGGVSTVSTRTPLIGPLSPQCQVSFWYYIDYSDETYSGTVQLEFSAVDLEKNDTAKVLWSSSGRTNKEWKKAVVNVGRRLRNLALQMDAVFSDGLSYPLPVVAFDDFEYLNCNYFNFSDHFPANLSCSFTNNWCNWYQETTYDISIVRQSGHRPSTGPGPITDADGQTEGQYLYIPAYKPPQTGLTRLTSFTLSNNFERYCFFFSYHMFGFDPTQSLTFSTRFQSDIEHMTESVEVLKVYSRMHGSGWRMAWSEFSVEQNNKEVFFEISTGSSPLSGVAVDSIKIMPGNCDSLSTDPFAVVDFESYARAGYYNIQQSNLFWFNLPAVFSKNEQIDDVFLPADHTTNSERGIAFIADFRKSHYASAARAQSLVYRLSANVPVCLSFFYQIGEQVSLSVDLFSPNRTVIATLWTATSKSSFNRRWHRGLASYTSAIDQNVTIVFVGLMLGQQNTRTAVVMIDDILLQIGQECSPVADCDFDGGFCGFSFVEDNQLDWERSAGYQLPAGSTGPAWDASDSPSGSYAFIQSFEGAVGKTAVLESDPVVSDGSPSCFSFSYFIFDDVTGNLSTRFFNGNTKVAAVEWWDDRGTSGLWRRQLVDVPGGSYLMVQLVATLGTSLNGSIAVDDVMLHGNRSCADVQCVADSQFSCDGETLCIERNKVCDFVKDCNDGSDEANCGECDFGNATVCGWKALFENTLMRWQVSRGVIPDRTTNSVAGWYMAASPLQAFTLVDKPTVTIVTPLQGPIIPSCAVSFWYYLYPSPGRPHKEPVLRFLSTFYDGGVGYRSTVLWTSENTTALTWTLARVPIGFRVRNSVFQFDAELDGDALPPLPLVAIDDVKFDGCDPAQQSSLPITCTFESESDSESESECGWFAETDTGGRWIRSSGHRPTQGTGPTVDHTFGNQTGHYLYMPTADNPYLTVARISSAVQQSSFGPSCLTFWFHMYGMDVERLDVLVRMPQFTDGLQVLTKRIWSRVKSNGNKWTYAQASVLSEYDYSVVFEGYVGRTYLSEIAIDDIRLVEDSFCETQNWLECDFEVSSCGFESVWSSPAKNSSVEVDAPEPVSWDVRQAESAGNLSGVLGNVDHTTGSAEGAYMFTSLSPSVTGEDAVTLQSPLITYAPFACVTFFYEIGVNVRLVAGMQLAGVDPLALWDSSVNHRAHSGSTWHFAQFQVNSSEAFSVLFTAVCSAANCTGIETAVVAIDDLYISNASCPLMGSCDFERDLCAYDNAAEQAASASASASGGAIEWLRNSGATTTLGTGPTTDVTTRSDRGFYLYVPAYKAFDNNTAILQSDILPPTYSQVCYRFWYHMYGEDVGSLTVSVNAAKSYEWQKTGNQGDKWLQGQIDLGYVETPWSARISALINGEKGDIAIDEVTIHDTSCNKLQCPGGQFQCAMGECIEGYQACDFVKNCNGSSADETSCGACTFDTKDECGWSKVEETSSKAFDWKIGNTVPDHSGNGGFYTVVRAQQSTSRQDGPIAVATQTSAIGPISPKCKINFWYYIDNSGTAAASSVRMEFSVVDADEDKNRKRKRLLWSSGEDTKGKWLLATVAIGRRERGAVLEMKAVYGGDVSRMQSLPVAGFDDFAYVDCGYVNQPLSNPSAMACEFSSGNCDWYPETTSEVSWVRQAGHASLGGIGPAVDASGSQSGSYLYASSYEQKQETTMRVSSLVMAADRSAYCLSFSTHSFGNGRQRLDVYARKQLSQEKIENEQVLVWSRARQHGDEWSQQSISVAVGFNYELVFEARVSDWFGSGIAIDSISVDTRGACALNVFAVADFDSDANGYVSAADNSKVWYRSTGAALGSGSLPSSWSSLDHSTNTETGGFFVVDLSEAEAAIASRLESPQLSLAANKPVCISFYYQLAESYLSVDLRVDGNVVRQWTASAASSFGKRWHRGQATYTPISDQSARLLFTASNANRESNRSIAAIDDVYVEVGVSCTPTPNCNFDQGFCDYSFDEAASVDWERGYGAGRQQKSVGPAADADGSTVGYYAVVQALNLSSGQIAVLQSDPVMGMNIQTCLSLSYFVSDAYVGTLSASILLGSEKTHQRVDPVSYGRWNSILIDVPAGAFMAVEFRAELEESKTAGAIAVDNVRHFIDESCAKISCSYPYFSCDNRTVCLDRSQACDMIADCVDGSDEANCATCSFSKDSSCGWSTVPGSEPLSWNVSNSIADHSGTTSGWSLMVSLQAVRGAEARDSSPVISVRSPVLGPLSPACSVSFWYYVESSAVHPQTQATLQLGTLDTNGESSVLWSQNTTTSASSSWIPVTVAIGFRLRNAMLQFDAELVEYAGRPLPVVAIDDVTLNNCGPKQPDVAIDCSFESGSACGWFAETDTAVRWTLNSGHTPSMGTGPTSDHTYANQSGHYMYMPTGQAAYKTVGRLSSIVREANFGLSCFSFWYHMYGMDVEKLNVLQRFPPNPTDNTTSTALIWSQSRSTGNEWRYGQVSVSSDMASSIVFEGYVGKTYLSEIAIDDIAVNDEEACGEGDSLECDFEVGQCGFTSQWISPGQNDSSGSDDSPSWQHRQMMTLGALSDLLGTVDHSTDTSLGSVMFSSLAESLTKDDTVLLRSPVVSLTGSVCVTFFYQIGVPVTLSASVESQVGPGSAFGSGVVVWDASDLPESSATGVWRYAQFQVDSESPFRVVFTARCTLVTCEKISKAVAVIDDIRSSNSACASTGSCDFERDTCGYSNVVDVENSIQWLRNAGATLTSGTGPSIDVTKQSDAGFYVYVPSYAGLDGSTATLRSELFPAPLPRSDVCYRFWYHTLGDSSGLDVRIYRRGFAPAVFSTRGDKGDKWHQAELGLASFKVPWSVDISSTVTGAFGDVAVDEIQVYNQNCASLPCLSDSFQCAAGSCIEGWKTCDFVSDCGSGLDEASCGACNFSNSDCGWATVEESELIWTRTSKIGDHSGDRECLMVVDLDRKRRVSTRADADADADTDTVTISNARTPVIGPLAATCKVNFWYYLSYENVPSGGSVGLELALVDSDSDWDLDSKASSDSSRRVVWSSWDATADSWKQAGAFIGRRARNVSLEFRATFIKTPLYPVPVVAIDDFSFTGCAYMNQSADVASLDCNFSNGWCGWYPETMFDSNWNIQSGHAERAGRGPSSDGDGAQDGMYLYAAAYEAPATGLTRFTSGAVSWDFAEYCLEFSYHIFGPEAAAAAAQTLNVYSRDQASQTSLPEQMTKVWSSTRHHGNTWERAQVQVSARGTDKLQEFVFEAMTGTSMMSGVAIDSIQVDRVGRCSRKSSFLASFDYSVDNYTPVEEDYYCWHLFESADFAGKNVSGLETRDHTANSDTLGYMACQVSDSAGLLQSPMYLVKAGVAVCFRFFYQLTDNAKLTVQLNYPDASRIDAVWSGSAATNFERRWRYGQVEFTVEQEQEQNVQIRFAAQKAGQEQGQGQWVSDDYVLIDDAEIMIGTKCPSVAGCSFDDDYCSYSYAETNKFDWERSRGADLPSGMTAPQGDAAAPFDGAYTFVEAFSGTSGSSSRLQSDAIGGQAWPTCLGFSYYMNGENVGSLTASVYTSRTSEPVKWTQTASQGSNWLSQQLEVPPSDLLVFAFDGNLGEASRASIAIDDVVYYSDRNCSAVGAVCPEFTCRKRFECVRNANVCDMDVDCFDGTDEAECGQCSFEGATKCGWQNVKGNGVDWRFENGLVTGRIDHTTWSKDGYAMFVSSNPQASASNATVITSTRSLIGPLASSCSIDFWYQMACGSLQACDASLALSLIDGSNNEVPLYVTDVATSNWTRVNVAVGKRSKTYSLKFTASFLTNHAVRTDIGIDDIAYLNCGSPTISNSSVNCDFESDTCGWYVDNSEMAAGKWQRQAGKAAMAGEGPLTDNTRKSSAGSYALVPTSYAFLQSQLATGGLAPVSEGCFSFFYHLRGVSSQSLLLFQRTGESPDSKVSLLWAKGYSSGNDWVGVSVPVRSDQVYKLMFEGYVDSNRLSDVALDDTSLSSSGCVSQGTDCSFEVDLCKFTVGSSSTLESAWSRVVAGEQQPSDAIPPIDRSAALDLGYYVQAKFADTDSVASATLYSGWASVAPFSSNCYSFYYAVGDAGWLELYMGVRESGTSEESLSLVGTYRKSRSVKNSVVRWHLGQVPVRLTSGASFRFHFVGKRSEAGGETEAAVAIDFAQLSAGSCVADAVCNFDSGLCDFEDLGKYYLGDSTALSWMRTRSAQLPIDVSRPAGDHSASGNGDYLMLSAFDGGAGGVARLESGTVAASSDDRCFMFWYQLNGAQIGQLRVGRQFNNEMVFPLTVAGSLGPQWVQGRLDIPRNTEWNVLFEARLGNVSSGYIAVDDFALRNFACRSCFDCNNGADCISMDEVCDFIPQCSDGSDELNCPYTCSFDSSSASSSPSSSSSDSNWNWNSNGTDAANENDLCFWEAANNYRPGSLPGDYVPMNWSVVRIGSFASSSAVFSSMMLVDKSVGSPLGNVLAATPSAAAVQSKKNSFGVLRSPVYRNSGAFCRFSMSYRVLGEKRSVDEPSEMMYELSVQMLPNGSENDMFDLWRSTYARPDLLTNRADWVTLQVQMPGCYSQFQLQVTAVASPKKTAIVIDEIRYDYCARKALDDCSDYGFFCASDGVCVAKDSLCDLQNDCCDGSDEAKQMCGNYENCTFASSLCKFFTNQTGESLRWERKQTDSNIHGPLSDHSNDGWYLEAGFNTVHNQEEALLALNYIAKSGACQIRFWYQFFDNTVVDKQSGARSSAFGVLNVYALSVSQHANAVNGTLLVSLPLVSTSRLSWSKQSIDLGHAEVVGGPAQLVLSARVSTDSGKPAWFAIDDVSFTPECTLLSADAYPLQYSVPVKDILVNVEAAEDSNVTVIVLSVFLGLCVAALIACAVWYCRTQNVQFWRRGWKRNNNNSMMANPLYDMGTNEFAVMDYDVNGFGNPAADPIVFSHSHGAASNSLAGTSGQSVNNSSRGDSKPTSPGPGTSRQNLPLIFPGSRREVRQGVTNEVFTTSFNDLTGAQNVQINFDDDTQSKDRGSGAAKLELALTPEDGRSVVQEAVRNNRY